MSAMESVPVPPGQVQLAAVVLTKNVAQHIGPCLDTLAFADAVVVSDSFSDDGTVERARAAGATSCSVPLTISRASATRLWRR